MRRLTLAVLTLAAAASAAAQEKKPAGDPAVAKLAGEFAAAFNAKDPARVAALYAEDAVLMPPNQPAVRGRAAIEAWFKQGFGRGVAGIALEPWEQRASGDLAVDAGLYTIRLELPGGQKMEAKGKYLVLLKRVGGQWKVAYDIDNPDAPPPPPPSAPAR